VVTYGAGARVDGATEFLVAMARRSVIEEYERVCLEVGAHAGLVDLSTLSVLNLFLAQSGVPAGDWLVVHMRPRYTSLVIMRGQDPVFFRNRPDTDGASLSDLVHQTAMYYQDRLSGQGFERVFLGGSGPEPGALEHVRQSLEQRLELTVDTIDPTKVASPADRIQSSPDDLDVLAPLVGMLLRDRGRVAA